MSSLEDLRRYKFSELGTETDIRKPRTANSSAAAEDAMDSMLNIILTHKKEIQKVPQFSSVKSSNAWLQRHPNSGLRVQEKDLDGDGSREVVLYNKAGQPVIVNGYKLRANDYPVRRAYWSNHPDPIDREGVNYKHWAQEYVYDVTPDPKNEWIRDVAISKKGQRIKDWGYRLPVAPVKRDSPYSIFCKFAKNFVNEYLNSEDFAAKLKASPEAESQATDANVKFVKKLISPLTIYRMLYLKLIERYYFYHLKSMNVLKTYKEFESYKKNHKNAFFDWFMTNYMVGDKKEGLRKDRLDANIIATEFVNGALNIDGSDLEDSLVFMIGLDNINDADTAPFAGARLEVYHGVRFADILFNHEAAEPFLESLSDRKDDAHRSAKLALEKWKAVAQASTKQYFKEAIPQLYESEQGYNNWLEKRDVGVNELAQDPAVAEVAEAPSPMKMPQNKPDQ